ncbi:MAG: hypothetical protein HGB00_02020 [Chlorobiaceae bacterium]|nr:hypothetical protein [Chlorobiaceae bacterium]
MITLSEVLSIIAYCLFLAGAARSFQGGGSRVSLMVMSAGVLLDMVTAVLPSLGILPPMAHTANHKLVVMYGVMLGFLVWVLFGVALLLHRQHRQGWYHQVILVVEILWFIDVMVFLYGVYR